MTITTSFSIYDASTGEIVSSLSVSGSEDLRQTQIDANIGTWGSATHAAIEVATDPDKDYIVILGGAPVVADRPPIPYRIDKTTIVAGNGDFATLSGLHTPCDIILDDPDPTVETTTYTVTGGSFEFEAADPGVYTIEIRRFPFLPAKIEITAT